MKKHLITALCMAGALTAGASTHWSLQGKDYNVDTLYHATIGPGTTQTSLSLSGGALLRIHYTTVDLSNPNVELRTLQAGTKLTGGAKISAMAAKAQSSNLQVVSGVNADFFGNSQPIGLTVVNGEYWKATGSDEWTAWAQMGDRSQFAGHLLFGGTATAPSGATHAVSCVNGARYENYLVVFNPRYGSSTGTNMYGYEVTATPIDGSTISPGKAAKLRITSNPASAGNMTIPSDGYVLSGHGTAAAWVSSLKEGDEITVTTTLTCDGKQYDAVQTAGGQPMILSGGEVLNTQSALDHLTSLNPRTAIGYDATGTKVVILAVDGRWNGNSVGVVSKVLADIMKNVGCSEAMNFDGGGSTTHWTVNRGVTNHPSDGTERSVVNGVFVVSPTPTDKEVASIEFVDWSVTLPRYGRYTPVLNTYNKYGVWLGTTTDVTLSCDRTLGEVQGNTLLADGSGTHALTATYNGCEAKIAVTIGKGDPEFRLSRVLVDGVYDYEVECQALVNGTMMSVGNAAAYWSSDNPSIATVDGNGVVHGVANGTTTIRGSFGAIDRTLEVTVEIPTEHFAVLDPMTSTDGWSIKGGGVTVNSVTTGPEGMDINYTAGSGRTFTITMEKEFKTWARPSAFAFDYDPGTSTMKSVKLTYSVNGERAVTVTLDLDKITTPTTVEYPWSEAFDTTLGEVYPVTISKMLFTLPGGGVTNTIRLSNLGSKYDEIPESGGVECVTAPEADPNAPVEYYNLQGIKVQNPTPGSLLIRRQGATATRILVK